MVTALETRRKGATFAAMATILLVGVDLFFRGKLEGLLAGHHLITVDSVEPPDCVICDIARIEPEDVADAYPDIPILGFANHTDTAGLRRADLFIRESRQALPSPTFAHSSPPTS